MAVFFAQKFKRILFISHREEILNQGKQSFGQIMPDRSGGIYNGKMKDAEAESIFVSVSTLSMKQHLEVFEPDTFGLIIVDEFPQATRLLISEFWIIFKLQFLLGITATPDWNEMLAVQ